MNTPSRPSPVLPFPPSFPSELIGTVPSIPLPSFACPNIKALPISQQPKAESLLALMQQALQEQQIEDFNEAKKALVSYFKKQGAPNS